MTLASAEPGTAARSSAVFVFSSDCCVPCAPGAGAPARASAVCGLRLPPSAHAACCRPAVRALYRRGTSASICPDRSDRSWRAAPDGSPRYSTDRPRNRSPPDPPTSGAANGRRSPLRSTTECEPACHNSPPWRVHRAPGVSLRPLFPGRTVFAQLGLSTPRDRGDSSDEYERATLSTVIARLDRATQYSRDGCDGIEKPRRTGYPACAGYDGSR